MKTNVVLTLFLILTNSLFCQKDKQINIPFDSLSQKYTYTKIFDIPNKNAQELFSTTKKWCIVKYLDDKFILEEPDTKLMDIGNFPTSFTLRMAGYDVPYAYTIIYSFTALFKNEKCKVEMTNIKLSQNAQGTTQEQTLESFKTNAENARGMGSKFQRQLSTKLCSEIDINMKKTLEELEKALKGDLNNKKDW